MCRFFIRAVVVPERCTRSTVFNGHLFVGDVPLDESGMEHHPLTPMTDANLVRVLQSQVEGKVGLVDYETVVRGAAVIAERFAALRREETAIAIVDAVFERDLEEIAAACADLPLVSGGSGVAMGLPENFRRSGLLATQVVADALPPARGYRAVIAGSCSAATQGQVMAMRARNPAFRVDQDQWASHRPGDRSGRALDNGIARRRPRGTAGLGAQVRQLRYTRLFRQGVELSPMNLENRLRDDIAEFGRSIFERGLTAGSSGNISVRLDHGWLLTPTNACLGRLDPARLSKLDWHGNLVAGDPPARQGLRGHHRRRSAGQAGRRFRGALLDTLGNRQVDAGVHRQDHLRADVPAHRAAEEGEDHAASGAHRAQGAGAGRCRRSRHTRAPRRRVRSAARAGPVDGKHDHRDRDQRGARLK